MSQTRTRTVFGRVFTEVGGKRVKLEMTKGGILVTPKSSRDAWMIPLKDVAFQAMQRQSVLTARKIQKGFESKP